MAQLNQSLIDQFGSEKLSVGWPVKFFIFTLILVLIVVLAYLGLNLGYGPGLQKQIATLDSNLNKISKDVTEADKENLILSYSQQENIKVLLKDRIFSSKIFSNLLEKVTHPKVYYTGLSLDMSKRQLTLSGVAESFGVLSEQMDFYDKNSSIVRYSLQDATLREGIVGFKVDLILADSLLK